MPKSSIASSAQRRKTPRSSSSIQPQALTAVASRPASELELDEPVRPTISMFPDAEVPFRPTIPMMSVAPPSLARFSWLTRRVIAIAGGCALAALVLVAVASRFSRHDGRSILSFRPYTELSPERAEPAVSPAGSARSDADFDRKGRSPIAGGLLFVPPAFQSEDGGYDLVLHFHGNTDVVEESFGLAKLNAIVVTTNLGNGSGPYEERFENPQAFADILVRVQAALEKRGLRSAHRRRVALSAWSAGYGAVERLLEHPDIFADVDAVLLDDGIHAGYLPKSTMLDVARIAMFEKYAREAIAGNKLFSIAHTEIVPIEYAGTRETTNALLADVGIERTDHDEVPAMPVLKSIEGVVAKKSLRSLKQKSIARAGGLIVRGYAGDQPEDHSAQLFGMSVTTLPDLVERWAKKSENESGDRAHAG